jgi:hypothetical protein
MIRTLDIAPTTNSIRLKTLKQGKDRNGAQREKYRVMPLHIDLRDTHMQYLLDMNISNKSENALFPMSR